MFRGKESSNNRIISISSRLIEFWCFGLPAARGWGWLGGAPHTHAHARMCMHASTCAHGKHDNFMQMAAPIGGPLGIPYDVICACMCMCVHVCGAPSHHPPPTSTHPLPPSGAPPESIKIL